jgi:hypothetical protein
MSAPKPLWIRILPCLLTPAVLLIGLAIALFAASLARGEPARRHAFSAFSGHCRLLYVDSVQFQDGGRRGWYLYIGGLRRFANMNVGLDHRALSRGVLTVEVVGCTPNFVALPIATPFDIELPLRDIPRARAIRIVGENGATVHRLPGR